MKYYYDCPIEAAYMAKNFGMQFRSTRNQVLYFDGGSDFRSEKDCGIYGGEYYFLAPESLALLEPREGDIVKINPPEGRSQWLPVDYINDELVIKFDDEKIGIGGSEVAIRARQAFLQPTHQPL